MALLAAAPVAHAQAALGCDARMWLTQSQTLYAVGTTGNPFTYTGVGNSSTNINALDLNPSDGYIYGMRTPNSTMLVRIGSNGVGVNQGNVGGLPGGTTYRSGAIPASGGALYVMNNNTAGTNRVYRIDLATQTATAIALSRTVSVADLAFVGSTLYSVEESGQLISIDLATGAVNDIGSPTTPFGFIGALFGTPTRLYGSLNTGGFYQIDLSNGAKTLISDSPPSDSNDGAHCASQELNFGADLAITKTNTPGSGPNDLANDNFVPGTTIPYTIVVRNNGPFGASDVAVSDPLPAGITTASWTCSATGGGVCPAASGSGAINTTDVSLPVGATVTYVLSLQVPLNYGATLANTATVAAGPGTIDTNTSNNTATDTDPAVPRITLRKTTVGGVGAFAFSGTNGYVGQTITTTVPGTTVTGTMRTLTAPATATTITEAAVAGYAVTDITCTGLGSGGTATPNLAARSVTLNAAATAVGVQIVCTFTNTKQPVIRLAKALPGGRIAPTDQFALSITGPGGPATVTTTGTGSTATGTATLSAGTDGGSYTLSEAAAGSTNLALYASSYACTNALAGGQTPSGSGTSFSLTAIAGDDLSCTFSNAVTLTDLSVVKTVSPASAKTGDVVSFTLTVNNAGPNAANGAVLRDVPGAGLNCSTPSLTATCSASGGASCPAATVPVASLTGPTGIVIPALPAGGGVVVTMQCTVTASGT